MENITIFTSQNRKIKQEEDRFISCKEYYSMDTLDKTDLQILRILQENARLTTKELAARVSLSSTPVFERLKRLENKGYIKNTLPYLTQTNSTRDLSYSAV